jgi:hypothetical protein
MQKIALLFAACLALYASAAVHERQQVSGRILRPHIKVMPGRPIPPRTRQAGSPSPLDPATVKSIYNYPTSNSAGAGQTIAIVGKLHIYPSLTFRCVRQS